MRVFTVYVRQELSLEGWKDPVFHVILHLINIIAKQTNQKLTEEEQFCNSVF